MENNQPIIGISCGHQWTEPERYYVNAGYIHAVLTAGGIPILIPYMDNIGLREVIERIDGLLLPGGIDIDAKLFGELPHPKCGEIDPLWDELDIALIKEAVKDNLPILAICRGIQILNVAMGGTLIQDIPSQVPSFLKHAQQAPRWYGTHTVSVSGGSILESLFGKSELWVNSFHHQAVKDVAPHFRASAVAPDGVIEAIESVYHPFVVGVQWHPELMVDKDQRQRQLFSSLINNAGTRKKG